MKDTTKKELRKFHSTMQKKQKISGYFLIAIITTAVILTAALFYQVGKGDAEFNQQQDEAKQKDLQVQQTLMQQPVEDVQDTFVKFLMVKCMYWLKWIVIALMIGWILHGLF